MTNASTMRFDLAIEPIEIAALCCLQGNRDIPLSDAESELMNKPVNQGNLATDSENFLFRLWPHQSYLLSNGQVLAGDQQKLEPLMTDISDSYCAFRLSGDHVFEFVTDYLSADLTQVSAAPNCLRCRLGQFVVILWWQNRQALQVLVERSCAQSFSEYLETLKARWRPEVA